MDEIPLLCSVLNIALLPLNYIALQNATVFNYVVVFFLPLSFMQSFSNAITTTRWQVLKDWLFHCVKSCKREREGIFFFWLCRKIYSQVGHRLKVIYYIFHHLLSWALTDKWEGKSNFMPTNLACLQNQNCFCYCCPYYFFPCFLIIIFIYSTCTVYWPNWQWLRTYYENFYLCSSPQVYWRFRLIRRC